MKAFGREKWEIRGYLHNQIKLIRLSFRSYWLSLQSGATSSLINALLQGGVGFHLGYPMQHALASACEQCEPGPSSRADAV